MENPNVIYTASLDEWNLYLMKQKFIEEHGVSEKDIEQMLDL